MEASSGEALYSIANIYLLKEEWSKAVEFYNKTEEAGFKRAELYQTLAGIFFDANDITQALRNITRAIEKIYRLKEQKQAAQTGLAEQKETKKKIQTAIRFLRKQQPEITEFDEALVGRPIERITIQAGRIKVCFKSGVEIGE